MQKVTIFLLIGIVLSIISIALVYINPFTSLSPNIDWNSCKIISDNGPGKINIVFLASEENAKKFSDYLFNVEPYSSKKGDFNIFYVPTTPKCEIYKDVAIFCYSRENLKAASVCPNDYIIAVSDGLDSSIRSATYMNFLSINSKHYYTVVPHEFSHALANLADEYIPATLPKNQKNCVGSCDKFSNVDGCFLGCSNNNYFRSFDNGIMRSLLVNDFGKLDSDIISSRIDDNIKSSNKKITGNAVISGTDCSKESYYLVSGSYNDGKMSIDSKTKEQGCVGNNGFGDFSYNLVMDDGSSFNSGSFNPELIFSDTQLAGQTQISGEDFVSDVPFLLKIPIIEDAKSLDIKDSSSSTIAQIPLNDDFSRFCRI